MRASLSLPRRGRALKAAEERSALLVYCGELFQHYDTSANTAKSPSHFCMVAVLVVSEYICKHFSAVWACALIPNYSAPTIRVGLRLSGFTLDPSPLIWSEALFIWSETQRLPSPESPPPPPPPMSFSFRAKVQLISEHITFLR